MEREIDRVLSSYASSSPHHKAVLEQEEGDSFEYLYTRERPSKVSKIEDHASKKLDGCGDLNLDLITVKGNTNGKSRDGWKGSPLISQQAVWESLSEQGAKAREVVCKEDEQGGSDDELYDGGLMLSQVAEEAEWKEGEFYATQFLS